MTNIYVYDGWLTKSWGKYGLENQKLKRKEWFNLTNEDKVAYFEAPNSKTPNSKVVSWSLKA